VEGAQVKKGFTLIEVMLSLCIIMFFVLAVSRLSILAIHSKSYGENITHATVLGHIKLVSLRSLPFTCQDLRQDWHQDPLNPLVSDGMEFYRFWTVADKPQGKDVTLYVAWHGSRIGRVRNFGSLEDLRSSQCARIDIREMFMDERSDSF
jgi:prepilin-type N-terminal cleavage/methylation domain-containing protein